MYVCMHLCMHVCMHAWMYVCMHGSGKGPLLPSPPCPFCEDAHAVAKMHTWSVLFLFTKPKFNRTCDSFREGVKFPEIWLPNASKCFQDASRCLQMLPDVSECFQILPDAPTCPRCLQMLANACRCSQMDPDLAQSFPVQSLQSQSSPLLCSPGQSNAVQSSLVQPNPVQSSPVNSSSAQSIPSQSSPAKPSLVQSSAAQAGPSPVSPAQPSLWFLFHKSSFKIPPLWSPPPFCPPDKQNET